MRRAGVARILIAEGPSVDPRGVTRLGGLDAADAVRINLPATLMSEAQLTLAIARGEACALLLASDAVAADGSAVLLAGGVALAAAAAARKIPILLVATPSAASPDSEALARRIAEAEATELHAAAGGSVAVRSVAAGVTVRAPRYEILAAGVAERI
jgi:methylthioribose-1-phosphate isomerase